MPEQLDALLEKMRALEIELETEFTRKRGEIEFSVAQSRIHFPLDVLNRHRLNRVSVWRFLRNSRLLVALTAPIIYSGLVVFILMDVFTTVYERLCFPIYGIPRVRRGDYVVFDRAELPYLNLIEKLNCAYCSYGNGVSAFLQEVAARSEQYWCPIKHARKVLGRHGRYAKFFEFGDAESYRAGLERLRSQYETGSDGPSPASTK